MEQMSEGVRFRRQCWRDLEMGDKSWGSFATQYKNFDFHSECDVKILQNLRKRILGVSNVKLPL